MKRLLRIGDMARLTGVSIKALRFYDEQGLLRPDHVDPQTGYRYYAAGQAEALADITNLRAVDFSIQEIADLIAKPHSKADMIAAIARKKRELRQTQADLDEKLRIADILSAVAADERPEGFSAFRLTAPRDQTVYAQTKTVDALGGEVTAMFEAAETIVAEAGARADAAPFLIFHDPPTKRRNLKVEVCIPVRDGDDRLAAAKCLAGSRHGISAVYQGGYAKTNSLYEQMTAWVERVGLIADGPLREIYHRFGADQDDYALPAKMLASGPAEYLTELMLPVSLPRST
jgi:DNA-binding transcriptional MerR regulator